MNNLEWAILGFKNIFTFDNLYIATLIMILAIIGVYLKKWKGVKK